VSWETFWSLTADEEDALFEAAKSLNRERRQASRRR